MLRLAPALADGRGDGATGIGIDPRGAIKDVMLAGYKVGSASTRRIHRAATEIMRHMSHGE